MKTSSLAVPVPDVSQRIHTIRGQRVILDADLATLYGVRTKNLNKAVQRNRDRFPEDFMFQLTLQEAETLRFQSGTSKAGRGGRRYRPYVFTQEGIAMLSSVLNSPRAVQVNIAIMRAFVKIRSLLVERRELAGCLAELDKKLTQRLDVHETAIVDVLQRIMRRLDPPPEPEPKRRRIGFNADK